MDFVNRRLTLALVACWLSLNLLSGLPVARADDVFGNNVFAGGDAAEQSVGLSGSDIWGRVNPQFYGFPTVSFAADLVVLQRSTPAAQPILFDNLGNSLLNTADFGNPAQAGARLNLTFFDRWDWDFMLDLLFMGEMTSQRTVDRSGGVNLFFYQGVAVDPVDTASFRSALDTGEFNARRRLSPQLALLGGVRYLQLAEDLDFNLGGAPGGYTSQADNRLFGGQLGAEGVLPLWGYGRLFATGKYGIYNDHFRVSAQALSGGAPISIAVHHDMTAFVGEYNVGWEVQTFSCMTLRFGYQVLWLTDVALVTDQLNQYSIFNGTGSVRKGNALYQGGFAGLVFTF